MGHDGRYELRWHEVHGVEERVKKGISVISQGVTGCRLQRVHMFGIPWIHFHLVSVNPSHAGLFCFTITSRTLVSNLLLVHS